MCQNKKTLVLASIHQPNNQLFLKFDSIYVLSREGFCIYSGKPRHLKSTLNECNIDCSQLQVPIEVLLKISSDGINDERVSHLRQLSQTKYEEIKDKCETQMKLSINGIKQKPKTFRFGDFWNLLLRSMSFTYVSQLRSLLIKLFFFIGFAVCLSQSYNQRIGKIEGCFSLATIYEKSCKELSEQIELLEENQYFIYFSSIGFQMTQISIATTIFLKEIWIFSAEHQNRKTLIVFNSLRSVFPIT